MLFLFDAGLIIVCLVSGLAVIETLAVQVYIQLVGGSCMPFGQILITSFYHKLKQLVCSSFPLCFSCWCWFVLSLFPILYMPKCTCALRVRSATTKSLHGKQVIHWVLLTFLQQSHPLKPRTHVVFTSKLRVDLIPAMYLVLFNSSPRLRHKQPKGSIYSNILTTFMNFSLPAQGNGLPAGWVEKMRHQFDTVDHTQPPCGLALHFKGLSPRTF